MFVDPSRWKNGVGRSLVIAALGFAKENGAKQMTVVGNPHALGFYLACGFKKAGPTETQFGPGELLVHPL